VRRTRWVGADGKAVDWNTVDRARRARDHAKKRAQRARARAVRAARANLRRAVEARNGVNRHVPSLVKVTSTSTIPLESTLVSNRSAYNPRISINTYRKHPIRLKPLRGIQPNHTSPPPKCAHSNPRWKNFGRGHDDHEELKAALLRLARAVGPP
jgi:hypothetical protein